MRGALSFKRTAREMTSKQQPPAETPAVATSTFTSSRAAASTAPPNAVRDSMASARPEASTHASSTSTSRSSATQPENYFKFTDKHERYLVKQARRHASALVVDALYDTGKWQFRGELKATSALNESVVARAAGDEYSASSGGGRKYITPAQHALEVFELRPSAIDRVACVAPRLAADPQQLAMRSHTLLARTRVRGKLDEFMGWMTSRRRAVYQGMMHTLHDGHLQHADVFSGFDAVNPDDEHALEQYALKYFVVESTNSSAAKDTRRQGTSSTPSTTSVATDAAASTASTTSKLSATKRTLNFLRRKGSNDSQDLTQLQHDQSSVQRPQATSTAPDKSAEGRLHFCVGEYSTVRHGVQREDCMATTVADQRVGIISYHSVEDPELLQLCNSVAKKTTPREVRHCTSRTLLQCSGVVAYPVASEDDDGADYLEVVIKVSCFDARGLTAQKRASMFSFISAFRSLSHMMLVMRLRASPYLTATNWVADARRKCCMVCAQRFSSLRRRHHCRLCGEVTCAKCSAVHQVRLVKEAKASLRICVLCVQGVERPKWKELAGDAEASENDTRRANASTESVSQMTDDEHFSQDEGGEEPHMRETEPINLLDVSFVQEFKKPRSPTSIIANSPSPEDPLLHSHGPTVSSSTESESKLDSTIRDFHDSAFLLPMKSASVSLGNAKQTLLTEDLDSVHESSVNSEDENDDYDEEFDPERIFGIAPTTSSTNEAEEDRGFETRGSSIRRISSLGDDDDDDEEEEDADHARLQALSAYGLLETANLVDGVMPEDFALQTIVKEAAHLTDCAIAAIGFVDASRDMVSATYSASPLCQVPRGVLPKQHSLTWEVMQRCSATKQECLVVLDAAKDTGLKRNPFVLDTPFVRFMVGVPLRAWNGVVVGALMIADIQPRSEVSHDELFRLKSHAKLIETWLENKREEIASNRSSARGVNRADKLHDRLAEMLNTSYQTTLELQMRGMQMKQQVSTANPTSTPASKAKSHPTIRHVLF